MKSTNRILMAGFAFWLLVPQLSQAFYNPATGRWLSRDPFEDAGEGNRYGFVKNAALKSVDILGRWGRSVHYFETVRWSGEQGFGPTYAGIIGESDQGVDENWSTDPLPFPFGGQMDRHMNRPSAYGRDSRDFWYDTEFAS